MSLYLSHKIPANEQQQFEAKLRQAVARLGITDPEAPNWLMGLMDLESGINPSVKNSIGCVGLIQFCPDTPGGTTKTIGGQTVSLSYLQGLTATQQLDYVEKYLADVIKMTGYVPKSFVDLQLMLFLPAALNFGYEEPIFIKSEKYMDSVKKNNPLYVDSKGNITKKQIESVYKKRYAGLFEAVKEVAREAVTQPLVLVKENPVGTGIIAAAFLITGSLLLLLYIKHKQQQNG